MLYANISQSWGKKVSSKSTRESLYKKNGAALWISTYYRTMLSFLRFVLTRLYPHKTGNALFIDAILKGFAFFKRKWGLTKHPVYQVHLIHQCCNEICNLFNLLKNLARKDVFICILQLKKKNKGTSGNDQGHEASKKNLQDLISNGLAPQLILLTTGSVRI